MIKVENISFGYGKTSIYSGFNLEIPKGQVALMTGINGVGKSTLLKIMAGVLFPSGGAVVLPDYLGNRPKEKIGFISDSLRLYESMTVKQAIEYHCDVYRLKRFDDSLIHHTKIRNEQKIKELSIGQRTILHLSMILSQEPEIILIDEVIHAIDAYLRDLFLQKIKSIQAERQLTIIMVNLNFHDIEDFLNRVILLKNGAIAVDEPIIQLKEKVKKVISKERINHLPVLFHKETVNQYEYYVYPYTEAIRAEKGVEVFDLNLTEIIKAFIGGEYA